MTRKSAAGFAWEASMTRLAPGKSVGKVPATLPESDRGPLGAEHPPGGLVAADEPLAFHQSHGKSHRFLADRQHRFGQECPALLCPGLFFRLGKLRNREFDLQHQRILLAAGASDRRTMFQTLSVPSSRVTTRGMS